MEKEFVTYKQALALKILGYDEGCFMIYYDGTSELRGSSHFLYSRDIKAPLKQQVFRWFRDKHKIQSLIQKYDVNNFMFTIDDGINKDVSVVGFTSYEEAESAGIDGLIEILKEK